MRSTRTSFRLAAVLAGTALALSACGGGAEEEPDTGAGDTAEDEADGGDAEGDSEGLVVGIKFDQPGLGLMEGEEPTGFDVDVALALAEELGYSEGDISWKEAPTPQRETLLETGQVNMVVATYSITEERKERVQFAGPYFVAGQDLLVRSEEEISGPDDLEGKILCSVTGSTSAANIQEEVPGVQLQEYGTYSECVEQLANGTIDALTTDDAILAGYAAQEQYQGKLKLVGNTFSEEHYGVGLTKEDERCEEINDILAGFWEDGTMEQIIADNFGDDYTPDDALNPPETSGHCG